MLIKATIPTKLKSFFLLLNFSSFSFCCRCYPCCCCHCCSHVTCHLTPVTNTNSHSQRPPLPLSIVGWFKIQTILKHKKNCGEKCPLFRKLCHSRPILGRIRKKWMFGNGTQRQTNMQTDGHSG